MTNKAEAEITHRFEDTILKISINYQMSTWPTEATAFLSWQTQCTERMHQGSKDANPDDDDPGPPWNSFWDCGDKSPRSAGPNLSVILDIAACHIQALLNDGFEVTGWTNWDSNSNFLTLAKGDDVHELGWIVDW